MTVATPGPLSPRSGVIDIWGAFACLAVVAFAALPFNSLTFRSLTSPNPLFWLSNLFLATEWTGARAFLEVSWSLDHGAGFYLLVGLALLLPAANRASRFACSALITAVAHLPAVADHLRVLSLWPASACGLAVRFAHEPTLPRALRVSVLLYPATLLALSKGGEAAAPLAALPLVLCLANESRFPAMPRALLHLGAASYSIYLVHIFVMSPAANLAVWIGQVVVGIAASLLFFQAVELPWERLRARLRPHASSHP